MPGRARRLTAGEVEQLLRRHGFQLVAQRGSHRKWRHPTLGHTVIVPLHGARVLPLGTLHSLLSAADIPPEEWHE